RWPIAMSGTAMISGSTCCCLRLGAGHATSSTLGSLSAPFVIARNGATQQPERSAPSPGLPRFARMMEVWDEDELTRRGPDGPARHHQHRRGFDLCPDAISTGAGAPALALRRAYPRTGRGPDHRLGEGPTGAA